jgi:hypothetical protein
MAKPGPPAPNSGMTFRMIAATAASSRGSMGRGFNSVLRWVSTFLSVRPRGQHRLAPGRVIPGV